MTITLSPAELEEVERFIASPEHRAWEAAVLRRWRPDDPWATHVAGRKAGEDAKRRAAKLKRTPAWADQKAIQAVYREARRLTIATGTPHHVDHVIPLQGRRVSGLHVATNLQILTGSENRWKCNRFEIDA